MNDFQARTLVKPYPLFRLTFFLVTGIFFSLSGCWTTLAGGNHEVLSVILPVLLLALGGGLFLSGYPYRFLFGGLAFAFMVMLGIQLGEERREEVHYDWPARPVVYRATLLERPQEKPKTLLCRLRVDAYVPVDSLAWVNSDVPMNSFASVNSVGPVAAAGALGGVSQGSTQARDGLSQVKVVPVHKVVWAYVMKDRLEQPLSVGDGLYVYTRVEPLQASALPGTFDYATYLFRKGVSGTAVVYPGHWQRTGKREPLSWKQRALEGRERILASYRAWGFRGDELAVLSALTVGYKDDLSEEVRSVYRQAGVSHILALSGMHVAILWGLLAFLLRPLDVSRVGRWLKCGLMLGILWGFAFLVGLSASVVRAVVMCMGLMIARAASSESSSLNSLSLAAAGMLIYDPFYLYDVGFQLSFLAVFSILLFEPLLSSRLSFRQPVLRYLWGVISVSLAAQLGTVPLLLHYFSHFPIYFLLANVWVAPCVCLIVYGTVLLWVTLPLGLVHDGVVEVLQVLLRGMNAGLRQLGAWPLADSGHLTLSAGLVVACYLVLLVGWIGLVYRSRKVCIPFLLALHAVLGGWFYQTRVPSPAPGLYLSAGQVKAFPEEAVWQREGLYRYRGMTVGWVDHNRWQHQQSPRPLPVDYLYLCRGYQGSIASLQGLFRIRTVVLDASLSAYRQQRYVEECRKLGLDFIVLKTKGSYRIFPEIRN